MSAVVFSFVLTVLIFLYLAFGNFVNLVFSQRIVVFLGILSEHGPCDFFTCGIHELHIEDLGVFSSIFADKILVGLLCESDHYLPVGEIRV